MFKKQKDEMKIPTHVAIIMDGNGRWAKKRGLPRSLGHKAGAQAFRKIVKHCEKLGVKYVTVYAFSTENWSRPKEEVDAIMSLFMDYMHEALTDFTGEKIRIKFIGTRTGLKPELIETMDKIEIMSKDKDGMTLNIAVNYGGRDEIVEAIQAIAKKCILGELTPEEITKDTVEQNLYTAGEPYPDLIIRPSGEERLSNFLTWQSAYSEFVYDKVLWPDFNKKHLEKAFIEYGKRDRRFGGHA